jgi:hypothetical protein
VAHDREFRRALGVALGGEASSERVAGESAVEPDSQRTSLDHVGYGPVAETLGTEPPVERSTERNAGPDSIPDAVSHRLQARTGQVDG